MFERQNSTMVKLFKKRVEREPEKTCYYFKDKTWTVADVSKNKINDNHKIVRTKYLNCLMRTFTNLNILE